MKQLTTLLEQAFERALWASRLVMLIAVVGSLLLAFGSFYLAIIDVISALAIFRNYSVLSLSTQAFTDLRNEAVTTIVRALDGFLISAILLLFAFGVYELFVSKINPARRSTAVLHFLASGTLDELKEKVARLVIVVLVIEFFQRALRVSYEQAQDLLYLAIGILLVSGAIYLTAPRRLEATEPSEGSHQQNETQRSS
jgi:uncharacterized membrane protein YqhA